MDTTGQREKDKEEEPESIGAAGSGGWKKPFGKNMKLLNANKETVKK